MSIFLLVSFTHAQNPRAAHARGKNPSKAGAVCSLLISPPGPRTSEEVLCMKGELSPD